MASLFAGKETMGHFYIARTLAPTYPAAQNFIRLAKMPPIATATRRTATPRPILLSVTLVLVTVVAGLAIRFAPLGLPRFVVKYGGSALWALMIYWIVSTILPRWPVSVVACFAAAVATTVEFGKLVHFPRARHLPPDSPRHPATGPLLLRLGYRRLLVRHLSRSTD